MSFIQLAIAPLYETVDAIMGFIKEVYGKKDVTAESKLGNLIEVLNDEHYAFIEYPYVDRVYRDSYYTYFSSKHNEYPRDCIRVSLFSAEITLDHFRDENSRNFLQTSYLGYFIVRPTFPNILGRTLLRREAFTENNFRICDFTTNVSINGVKLNINGFPFSSQDTEVISCAETTIWALMEYFSNRYADYKPANPSLIHSTLKTFSIERQIPSSGLTVDQISFALKEFGFGVQIYARDAYAVKIEPVENDEDNEGAEKETVYNDEEFYNIISTYVECGIPVVCFISVPKIGSAHANLLIGHEVDENLDFDSVTTRTLRFNSLTKRYIDYSDIPKAFIANDDNLVPYTKVFIQNLHEIYDSQDFEGCFISSIIVPLYNKIYLDATKAKKLMLSILTDTGLGFTFNNDFIFKFFLASSRSFKDHVAQLPELSNAIKNIIVLSKMPKFIWCAEIYFRNDFARSVARGLIIIDATEANQIWLDTLIFAGYPNRCIYKLGQQFVTLPNRFTGYSKYYNNLR